MSIKQLKDIYLVAYNGTCCAGWAAVKILTVHSLLKNMTCGDGMGLFEADALVYSSPGVAFWLTIAQSAALLKKIHAAVRLVRSPVLVMAMQVMSRIVALVAITYSTEAQST